MSDALDILNESGIPYAYDHFAEGESPDPPFAIYRYPATDNFAADGVVYYPINEVNIELYTDAKQPETERKLQRLFQKYEVVYEKDETWIPEERLYEVIYDFYESGDAGEEEVS